MIELIAAIIAMSQTNGNALKTLFPGKVYLNDGPVDQNAVDYCVISTMAGPNTPGYQLESVYEEPELQFAVWGAGTDADTLMTSLISFFKNLQWPALANGRQVTNVWRTSTPDMMPGSGMKDSQTRTINGWYVTYRFSITTQ